MIDSRKDLLSIATKASTDKTVLVKHLQAIFSKDNQVRFHSFKILEHLSVEYPLSLYKHWDFLAGLLKSSNHYQRFIALTLLANLARCDSKQKFEKTADAYFANIAGERIMVAVCAIQGAGKIAQAKPNLRKHITNMLIHIETMHQGKHTELIKAAVIQAFDTYYEVSTDKDTIRTFVKAQTNSTSPKTRKQATLFLTKWKPEEHS